MEVAKEQAISDPAFSIIVPVRNRWGPRLRNCMMGLEIQTLQPLEIIVADYGSTEQGHEAMMKTLDDFNCSVYYYRTNEVWSLAIARNMGIRRSNARCRNVAAIDADLILESRVVEALAKSHESGPRSYISCFIRMLMPKVWPHLEKFLKNCGVSEQFFYEGCMAVSMAEYRKLADCMAEYRKLYPSNLDENPDNFELPQDFAMLRKREFWPSAGWGGLTSAPRSWLFKVRGFDERMKFWGAEDKDLWKRAGLDNMDRYRINDLRQGGTEIYHQFHDDGLSWDQTRLTRKRMAQIEWNKLLAEKDYTLMRNNDIWGLWQSPRSNYMLKIKDARKPEVVVNEQKNPRYRRAQYMGSSGLNRIITIDVDNIVVGVPEAHRDWWNWQIYIDTWSIIDAAPDTAVEELPLYGTILRNTGQQSIARRSTRIHVELYLKIKAEGFDPDRPKRISGYLQRDGKVWLNNGHHRVSMIKHFGTPRKVKVMILGRR